MKTNQISRSAVQWYDHNDLNSLRLALESVEKESKKKRALARQFIFTGGIFEKDSVMTV